MKKTLFVTLTLFLAGLITGCVEKPLVSHSIRQIADKEAEQFIKKYEWGKEEYAHKQFAGFVYDSTGIYGNLHGRKAPEVIWIRFAVSQDDKHIIRTIDLPRSSLYLYFPLTSPREKQGCFIGIEPNHFKWLYGYPSAQNVYYGKTFWLSWKAFGLQEPPEEGKLRISIHAMQRVGKGACFEAAEK